MSVLWVDEECDGILWALAKRLARQEVRVTSRRCYHSGILELEKSQGDPGTAYRALLADVILPKTEDGAALGPYIGLILADRAASLGVRRVCFLSVILRHEVLGSYGSLKAKHPDVTFHYFHKPALLNPGVIGEVVQALIGP